MKNRKRIYELCISALIASLYIALTLVSSAFGLSSGGIQLRLSEALCVLPALTPAAIPGLAVGCLVSNILMPMTLLDMILGPLATLLGALGAYLLRKYTFLVPLPNFVANTVAVPFIIVFGSGSISGAIPPLMLTVGVGEFISAYVLGLILLFSLKRTRAFRGDL